MIGAIILGIVAGFLGRLLMPGRDPMGFFATVLLGLAGALVGFYLFALIGIGDNDKIDLGGLVGAVIRVMILLALSRASLAGRGAPVAPGAGGLRGSPSVPPAAPDGGG